MGIDWVALIILLGAYAFSQVRSVPVRLRYGVFSAAAGFIALYKLRAGATGINLAFAVAAGGFAVWYAVKAIQARPAPR